MCFAGGKNSLWEARPKVVAKRLVELHFPFRNRNRFREYAPFTGISGCPAMILQLPWLRERTLQFDTNLRR